MPLFSVTFLYIEKNVWGESVNTVKERKGGQCLCEVLVKNGQRKRGVERWKRRPKKDRNKCRCHVCLPQHQSRVESQPSHSIWNTITGEPPLTTPVSFPSSLFHFTLFHVRQTRQVWSLESFFIVTHRDVYLKNNKHTQMLKLHLIARLSRFHRLR